jgi:DNA-directed RNA polymerase alpha subunit
LLLKEVGRKFNRQSESLVELGAEGKEMGERGLIDPTPELPDDTLIENVRFATRIRNVLAAAGLKTVGEVRETADEILLSFQDLGKASVAHLRETLGVPSTDGARPSGKKPA